jgi:hypothetical protein
MTLQPLRSSCRRRPYVGASTVKTTALYPAAGHQVVNNGSMQFVTIYRACSLPLALVSRLLKTSRLFSGLMWMPYGVEPSVLWAATSSRESLDRRERIMGTLRAAAALDVPISPSAWTSRCMALGAMPKGTAAVLPHSVVVMSMFSTLRRTRGRRRYLSNAVSFQPSLQSNMFRENNS